MLLLFHYLLQVQQGEPFGDECLIHVKEMTMQREVELEVNNLFSLAQKTLWSFFLPIGEVAVWLAHLFAKIPCPISSSANIYRTIPVHS